jgi:hypothetical protein
MEDSHFWLDIYFLPGSQETECISHYQAERAVRDNSIAMLQEAKERLENDLPPPTATPPRPPGMLTNYSNGGEQHGGLLCIYPEYRLQWCFLEQDLPYLQHIAGKSVLKDSPGREKKRRSNCKKYMRV